MRLLFTLSLVLFALSAQAQIVFAPSAAYTKVEQDDNTGTPAEFVVAAYDLKLGYLHSSGLYLGGMYSIGELGDEKNFRAGPTVGFNHYSGFYALFTYHLIGEQDTGPGTGYEDGMGPQIDIGWVFPLTAMFHIGPQITWTSIKYDKDETGTAIDETHTFITPALSLWFKF